MGRFGEINYSRLIKGVLFIGVSLIAVGVILDWILHASIQQLPAWEETLIVDIELLGLILLGASPVLLLLAE